MISRSRRGPKRARGELLCAFSKTLGQIVSRDDQIAPATVTTSDDDMRVRMTGIVVIDGDPIELLSKIGLHLRHQCSRIGFQVLERVPIFR